MSKPASPKAKPKQFNKQPLVERYQLPSTGRTAMMDFYALYTLWWEIGEGKDVYGYGGHIATVAPHRRRQTITSHLNECALQLGQAMVAEAKRMIYAEAEECCDENLIPPQVLGQWLMMNGPSLMQPFRLHGAGRLTQAEAYWRKATWQFPDADTFWTQLSWKGAQLLFNAPFWAEYADAYGGSQWATICERAQDVETAINHGAELRFLVDKIDRMFDLDHQAGMLFDRHDCTMRVTKNDLERRFNIRHVQDYKELVSPTVQNLILNSARYLESVEIIDLDKVREFTAILAT